LAIYERSCGSDHPEVAVCLNNLAELLRTTNRPDEAERLYRRAVLILVEFERRTGHEHPNFRAGLANYQGLLAAMGKTPEEIEQQSSQLDETVRSKGS
jgi:hypothetical protein